MEKIKILHYPTEQEPFVVVDKPSGLPSAPLSYDDGNNVVHLISRQFPAVLRVNGRKEIEKGLFHRLDTKTSGLLLLCTTQKFYDHLLEMQNQGLFEKAYTAFCNVQNTNDVLQGFPLKPFEQISFGKEFCVTSFFRKFGENGSAVRPVTICSGKAALRKMGKSKEYSTFITMEKCCEKIFSKCRIHQGFRHQVRCHLSWCGFPVEGDFLYNVNAKEGDSFSFFATSLDFPLENGQKFHIEKEI